MKKLVIIINGRGGVGKDTLCDLAGKHVPVMNISSITPIKEIAARCGWSGDKTDKSRKFLSDLKRLLTDYNEFPTMFLLEQYEQFLKSDREIMFVHIREGEEIDKLKNMLHSPCITLLIRRSSQEVTRWGNTSDDEVEQYKYDYEFDNCKTIPEAEIEFVKLLADILDEN